MNLKISFIFLFLIAINNVIAGPYEPAAGISGSTAINKDDSRIAAWATGVASYNPGANAASPFNDSAAALGKAEATITTDIVSLGDEGIIVLTFSGTIQNGEGWDIVVFENGFADDFLELARVQVSSDGINFVEFPGLSVTPNPVGTFSTMDTTNISNTITNAITLESWNTGYAGKYHAAWGTPYDLDWFIASGEDGVDVDINHITHIRIIDIKGDGSFRDLLNRPVYDPEPITSPGGGFDLDAVGVRYIENTPTVAVPLPNIFLFLFFLTLLMIFKVNSKHNLILNKPNPIGEIS